METSEIDRNILRVYAANESKYKQSSQDQQSHCSVKPHSSILSPIYEGFVLIDAFVGDSQFTFPIQTLRLQFGRGLISRPEASLSIIDPKGNETSPFCCITQLYVSNSIKQISKRHFNIYWDFLSKSWILTCYHKNGITIDGEKVYSIARLPQEGCRLSLANGLVALVWRPACAIL